MTLAEFDAAIAGGWRADVESVPVSPLTCVVPRCGLPMVEMVYRWRPDGMSVYEPRCRDHRTVTA